MSTKKAGEIEQRHLWVQEPQVGEAVPIQKHRDFEAFAEATRKRLIEGIFMPLRTHGWQTDDLIASPGINTGVPAFSIRVLAPGRVAHVAQRIEVARDVIPEARAVLMLEMREQTEMIAVTEEDDPVRLVVGFLRQAMGHPALPEGKRRILSEVLRIVGQ